MGAVSKTYADVLNVVERWYDRWAEDWPEDWPEDDVIDLEVEGAHGFARSIMRQSVLQNERPGERLTFDTAPFREAMTALEEAELDALIAQLDRVAYMAAGEAER